jgi:hypothetical protein
MSNNILAPAFRLYFLVKKAFTFRQKNLHIIKV